MRLYAVIYTPGYPEGYHAPAAIFDDLEQARTFKASQNVRDPSCSGFDIFEYELGVPADQLDPIEEAGLLPIDGPKAV